MSSSHTIESPSPPDALPPDATELSVSGMTCSNCARHVTEAIQSVPGVQSATVSLDTEHATVRWTNGAAPDLPALIHAIEKEGYGAKPVAESSPTIMITTAAGWLAGN